MVHSDNDEDHSEGNNINPEQTDGVEERSTSNNTPPRLTQVVALNDIRAGESFIVIDRNNNNNVDSNGSTQTESGVDVSSLTDGRDIPGLPVQGPPVNGTPLAISYGPVVDESTLPLALRSNTSFLSSLNHPNPILGDPNRRVEHIAEMVSKLFNNSNSSNKNSGTNSVNYSRENSTQSMEYLARSQHVSSERDEEEGGTEASHLLTDIQLGSSQTLITNDDARIHQERSENGLDTASIRIVNDNTKDKISKETSDKHQKSNNSERNKHKNSNSEDGRIVRSTSIQDKASSIYDSIGRLSTSSGGTGRHRSNSGSISWLRAFTAGDINDEGDILDYNGNNYNNYANYPHRDRNSQDQNETVNESKEGLYHRERSKRKVVVPIQNDEIHTGIIDVSSLEVNRIASHEKYVREKQEKQKKNMKMTSVNKMELFEENPSNPMRKQRRSFFEIFKNVMPYINIIYWAPMYQWKVDLIDDFMAGLIITIMLVPQAMAYAALAGLPPEYGLYGSIFPPFIYSLLGTSRELAVGPVAIVSMMVSSALTDYADDKPLYIALAIFMAFLIGMVQLLMGLFKLGNLVNFFSHPMLKGVICGASIMIGGSQLPKMFGIKIERHEYVWEIFYDLAQHYYLFNWREFVMGLQNLFLLLFLQKMKRRDTKHLNRFDKYFRCGGDQEHNIKQVEIQIKGGDSDKNNLMVLNKESTLTHETENLDSNDPVGESNGLELSTRNTDKNGERYDNGEKDEYLDTIENGGTKSTTPDFDGDKLAKASSSINATRNGNWLTWLPELIGFVDYLFDKLAKNVPGVLTVVIFNILITWGFMCKNSECDVQIVGTVDASFPLPSTEFLTIASISEYFSKFIVTAILISFVSFMESIAIAKTFAIKFGYKLDPNQELVALGTSNLLGAMCHSMPVTGSFSRTIVNAQSGCKSPLSSMVTAILMALVVTFLMPLLQYLPQVTLASIVLMACSNLFDLSVPKFLWKVKRPDFFVWLLSFVLVLYRGIEFGVIIGTCVALLRVIYRTSNPHWVRLGQLRERGKFGQVVYRDVERYPDALVVEGIEILRFDAQLYFANVDFFEGWIRTFAGMDHVKSIILDCSCIPNIDATAVHALSDLHLSLKAHVEKPVDLYFACVRGPVRDTLEISGLTDLFGRKDAFHLSVHDAVCHIGLKKQEARIKEEVAKLQKEAEKETANQTLIKEISEDFVSDIRDSEEKLRQQNDLHFIHSK